MTQGSNIMMPNFRTSETADGAELLANKIRAWYDFNYRPGYPNVLNEMIQFHLHEEALGSRSLLDACCGTGQVSQCLRSLFSCICLNDFNLQMLNFATQRLSNYERGTILSSASAINHHILNSTKFDVVAFGRSFHLCNRPDLLRNLSKVLKPHGMLVIVGDGPLGKSPKAKNERLDIKSELRSWLQEKYPGNFCANRTPCSIPGASHEQCIAGAGLSFVKESFKFERYWRREEAVGHLLSTCIVPDEFLVTERGAIVAYLEELLPYYECDIGFLSENASMEVIIVKLA